MLCYGQLDAQVCGYRHMIYHAPSWFYAALNQRGYRSPGNACTERSRGADSLIGAS